MDSVPGKTIRWIFGPMPNCSLYFEKLGASSLVSELGRQEHNFKNSQNRPPTARCEHRRPEDRRHFLSHLNFILTFCHEEGRVWPPNLPTDEPPPTLPAPRPLSGEQSVSLRTESRSRATAHILPVAPASDVCGAAPRPSHLAPPRPPAIPIALLLDCFCSDPPPPTQGNIGNQPALHATCT